MAADGGDGDGVATFPMPSLDELQHWTGVIGRAQQMVLEHALRTAAAGPPAVPDVPRLLGNASPVTFDMDRLARAQTEFWTGTMALWQRALSPQPAASPAETDRRFRAPEWREHPGFDLIRQTYGLVSDALLAQADAVGGLDGKQQERLRLATRMLVDALSPSNFVLTNPQALKRLAETRGESLLKGLGNLLGDLERGQLTHSAAGAFEIGRDLAATPGKVIHETQLFQLIQYTPTTERVGAVPLLIFPPWINRFYILDLAPEKSFVRWAVDQGLSVFMVSWRSADESIADTSLDDYVSAQLDALDVVRALLDVPAAHVIGYCVAGTVLAATLALLAARGEGDKVATATFFTAQVDFSAGGDLLHFVDEPVADLLGTMTAGSGTLDGRYMAAAFNLLRGRDLIWNYVVNNYLLGEEHAAFDLLHWNGDVTNLPAAWHQAYLRDFYRGNLLVRPGGITVLDTPLDLTRVTTPCYVQAGREDHIAPAESVWKITEHLRGPLRFVLAGSGHIAGVVNPPAAGKYQYWVNDEPAATIAEFVAGARETKGSWWPDWIAWIRGRNGESVEATGARLPGHGARPAIEDAPGRYVRLR